MIRNATLFIMLSPAIALAELSEQYLKEIDHLIQFVRDTDCELERNDERYTGDKAVEHILKKYDYYRDEIENTEDFIEYSASKSMLSGKVYTAHCPDQAPITSREWLMNELGRYRASQNQ